MGPTPQHVRGHYAEGHGRSFLLGPTRCCRNGWVGWSPLLAWPAGELLGPTRHDKLCIRMCPPLKLMLPCWDSPGVSNSANAAELKVAWSTVTN